MSHQRIAYSPPTIDDLQRLKIELGYSGAQMADLAGLAASNQWRKYTGGADPREVSIHMAFFIAARLSLGDDEFNRVLTKMRDIGCQVFAESQE